MKTVTLSQLADIQYGYPFDSKCFKENGKIRIVRIRDIKKPDEATFYDGDFDEAYIIRNGDIIVGMDGEFNCTIWSNGDALLNQRVARITPKSSVSKGYLYFFLKVKLKEEEQKVTCSTVKHLLNNSFRNLEIPFMPLERQMKVASILEKADATKQKREQANQIANRILQAVFLQTFKAYIEKENEWTKKLEDVCEKVIDIEHKMPKSVEKGVPFISAKDISGDDIDFEHCKYIAQEDHERLSRRCKPKIGDILYSRIGVKLGIARLVKVNKGFNISYSLCMIRPNNEVTNARYLTFFLNSHLGRSQARKGTQSIAVPDLGMKVIKEFKIIVPPIELQNYFAEICSKIESLGEKQHICSDEISELFNSLMSKAFKGELVQ